MVKRLKLEEKEALQGTNKESEEELSEEVEKANTTGTLTSKRKRVRKKRRRGDMKSPVLKHNFFIAFQIYDVGIHRKVKKLQEGIIARNPALHPALVNISTLHVTLAVTHLESEKEVKRIKEKLDEWATKNVNALFGEPCILNFTGVKTFSKAIAYVDIEPCENRNKLTVLSKGMNDVLSSAGFSTDRKVFTPHVTILKLSKDYKLQRSRKNFQNDFELLRNCNEHFGKQEVSSLQLLSMDEPKDEKGYYKCYHEIYVSDPKIQMDHSECCAPIPKPGIDISDKG